MFYIKRLFVVVRGGDLILWRVEPGARSRADVRSVAGSGIDRRNVISQVYARTHLPPPHPTYQPLTLSLCISQLVNGREPPPLPVSSSNCVVVHPGGGGVVDGEAPPPPHVGHVDLTYHKDNI